MEELVIRAKKGDRDALKDIFIYIKNDLYKIAKARFDNNEDAEDAVQETIITVIKSIKNLYKVERFKSWVITILINKCNTIYKKRKKYSISIDEIENTLIENDDCTENNIEFYSMLKCLEYKERLIMILYYSENYTIKEIGKILKMNENTVKTKISRAKFKIKNSYFGGEKNELLG